MASPAGIPMSQLPSLWRPWATMVQALELQRRNSRCRSYHKARSVVPDRSGPTLRHHLNHKKQQGRRPSRLRRMVISSGWNAVLFPSITQTGTGGCCACYSLLSGIRLILLTHPSDYGHASPQLGNANHLQPGSQAIEVANSRTEISSAEAEMPAVTLGKRREER